MTDRNCLTCLYIAPQSCDHRTHWCAKLGEWFKLRGWAGS